MSIDTTVNMVLRQGAASEWIIANPVLQTHEEGLETDTGNRKLGDGVTAWNALPYFVVRGRAVADSTQVVSVNFVPKQGTSGEWAAANPVLLLGEEGYETNTRSKKIGDGITAWNDLPYYIIQGLPALAIFDSLGRVKYGVITGGITGKADDNVTDIWELSLTTVVVP